MIALFFKHRVYSWLMQLCRGGMSSSILAHPFMSFMPPLFHFQNDIYSMMLQLPRAAATSLCLWLGQGQGFTVEFLDYPGQTTLVKWKDLQDTLTLEIWCLTTRHDTLPPILFGRPRSMEVKCDDFDKAL
jgi:hypothetical protein